MTLIEHWEDARLDRIAWYVGNLRDVIDRKPVRGLSEAQAGYESAMLQLEGAVEAERERIVALIRREASETFDMQLDFEFRQLADRIASGGGAVAR